MRTRIGRAVVPCAMLLALTTQVAAQDLPVLGQGNLSCQWALGYITAYNQYGADPKGDVSGGQHTEELMKWIDDYCHRNPTDSFYSASAALIRKFRQGASP